MDKKESKKRELELDDKNELSQKSKTHPNKKDSKNVDKRVSPKDGEFKGKNLRVKKNKDNQRKQKDYEDKRKSNSEVKFYTINGRNGLSVDIPNVTDTDLSVLDIDLDISELLKQPVGADRFLSSEFCSGLDSVVRAYSTTRGYITTTSGKVVADALRLSIRAFSLLCAIYRTQACCNLKSQNNLQINQLFTRKSIQSVNSTLSLLMADPTPSPSMINELTSISNTSWMQNYVSHLNKMYIPKALTDIIAYLYMNVFTAEVGKGLGTNSLLLFWPYSGNTTINDAYSTTITALDNLYATYPDLELMMKVCGFGPDAAMSFDFTRPLAGNELSIVYDPEIPRLLENCGALDCGLVSFSSFAYRTYFEYDAINSIFAFDQMKTIDTAHNLLYWMFNFAALANLNVSVYPSAANLLQVNGGIKLLRENVISEILYLPDNIQYFFYGFNSLSEGYRAQLLPIMYNVASQVTQTKGVTGLNSRKSILVKISVSVDDVEHELSFAISLERFVMLDGPNNYSYDIDEASVIMQNALPTLIYGQEWRTKLQLVYLNLANNVSGIKY